jgi:hypothetical protein
MLALLAVAALASPRNFDFFHLGPYSAHVPKPDQILGYAAGERHTNFRDQERVFEGVASAAKSTVREIQYGKTPEGRPLRIFVVSSAQNISNLEKIRSDHERLAKGEGSAAGVVPIVWINECIHGDETASFEAGMWTFYNLVASQNAEIVDALKRVVVIVNPVYNPDGHERYVVYYNSLATGSSDPASFEHREPGVISGRLNHYRFDMNRDRVAFSQFETREEFAEMLKWNPQVYVDQHGQVGSYFFPPEPMSINVNVDRGRNSKWTDYFGRATGAAFDRQGMSYYVKNEFDLYYPGYLDSSNTLSGAIGMTHETDGGRVLATEREDGSVLTLRQGIAKHFTSALAVVVSASQRSQDLISDYAKFKKAACTGESAGKFQRVVLTSPDPRPLQRLKTHLNRAGIDSEFVRPFSQSDAHDYWSGSFGKANFEGNVLVVDLAQPQAALAKALLEPNSDFEAEFSKDQISKKSSAPAGEKYPGPEEGGFYDLTGWALPYAYDLHAWWCESRPRVSPAGTSLSFVRPWEDSPVGYALRYSDQGDIVAVFDALQHGARAEVTSKPMTLGKTTYPRGTFLFLGGRNEDDYEKVLKDVSSRRHVTFEPLETSYPEAGRDSPGSESTSVLRKPSIAVVMGSGDRLSECGAIWFLLENEFQLPFTFLPESALGQDLSKFTCIVVPDGSSISSSDKFREWLSAGHVAVVLGDARSASAFQTLTDIPGEVQELPGSIFSATMDFRSFLTLGYDEPQIAVPLEGRRFYSRRKEGGSVITLSEDDKTKKLLTGWEWPDTEKTLKGALFLQDVPVGRGHVVIYTEDPTARAMWPGLYKSLLNALLIGSAG